MTFRMKQLLTFKKPKGQEAFGLVFVAVLVVGEKEGVAVRSNLPEKVTVYSVF